MPALPAVAQASALTHAQKAEAQRILREIKITDPALVAKVLAHPYPHRVAQGFCLLIQRGYSRREDLEAKSPCIYREVMLRTVKRSKDEKDIPVAFLMVACAEQEPTNIDSHIESATDLTKTILDFLAKQEDDALKNEASLVVGSIIQIIKNPLTPLKTTIPFLVTSKDLRKDNQLLILFKDLSIPYTKKNLDFSRTTTHFDAHRTHKISEFIFSLSSNMLLTQDVFTTLESQASTFNEIKDGTLGTNTFLFALMRLVYRMISLSKLSPAGSIHLNATTLALFLNSSREEIQSVTDIFKNLGLLETVPPSVSDPGIINVVNCVLTKQNIENLNLTVQYLITPSPEGVAASPEALRMTLCALPNLGKVVTLFVALPHSKKDYAKRALLQNNCDQLHELLVTPELTDPTLLAKIGAHRNSMQVANGLHLLHSKGLLYKPLDATTTPAESTLHQPYVDLVLCECPHRSGHKNLVQLMMNLAQEDLLNESLLNFLVQHHEREPHLLEETVLLINNFHQCKIPLTEANLAFSQQPFNTWGQKIAILCNHLAHHKLLTPSSFSLLILQEEEPGDEQEDEHPHRLNTKCATLLSNAIGPLATSKLSSPSFPTLLQRRLTVVIDLLKIDALNQPLCEQVNAEDGLALPCFELLQKEDLLYSWSIQIITANFEALKDPLYPLKITKALLWLKKGGVSVERIQNDFASFLTTKKKPEAWAKSIVNLYQCGYLESQEILQQLEALPLTPYDVTPDHRPAVPSPFALGYGVFFSGLSPPSRSEPEAEKTTSFPRRGGASHKRLPTDRDSSPSSASKRLKGHPHP